MAAAAAATVLGCCAFTCHSSPPLRRFSSNNRLIFPTARNMTSFLVLASKPEGPGKVSDENPNSTSFQDEVNYTVQLAAGSVAGAALIKYGSILFPDITRPNIVQALLMIFTPMIVAAYLLFKQSQSDI